MVHSQDRFYVTTPLNGKAASEIALTGTLMTSFTVIFPQDYQESQLFASINFLINGQFSIYLWSGVKDEVLK